MRKPGGYAITQDVDGGVTECDTFTCNHCQQIVHVPPKANPDQFGNWCHGCTQMVCRNCAGKPCVPWEKQMEQLERAFERDRLYEDIRS